MKLHKEHLNFYFGRSHLCKNKDPEKPRFVVLHLFHNSLLKELGVIRPGDEITHIFNPKADESKRFTDLSSNCNSIKEFKQLFWEVLKQNNTIRKK